MSPSVFLPPSGSRIVWLTTVPSKYTLALVTTDTPLYWKAVACIIRVQPFVGPARRAGNPLFSAGARNHLWGRPAGRAILYFQPGRATGLRAPSAQGIFRLLPTARVFSSLDPKNVV